MTELVCRECGRPRQAGRSLCHTCRNRSNPDHQPTGAGRGAPGLPKGAEVVAGRIEDFAELLGQGYKLYGAVERLGISPRTGRRYLSRLKEQQGAA